MGRPKKPIAPPPPRDPFAAWGDVPTDQRAERKRLARIVARDGRRIANYRTFCRELGAAYHESIPRFTSACDAILLQRRLSWRIGGKRPLPFLRRWPPLPTMQMNP